MRLEVPRRAIRVAGIVAVATLFVLYLFSEHRTHLSAILPYLLLLACPLMHLFMHHGHGQHGADAKGIDDPRAGRKDDPR